MNHKFLEPIKIGNQVVKNRIMFLAMAKTLSGFDGRVTTRDLAYIRAIAAGGTGLIIPGSMQVDHEWPSQIAKQPGIYDDSFIPGLARLADAAHEGGGKVLFQLWHPGVVDYSHGNPPSVNDVTVEWIHGVEAKFAAAAERAVKAGADGIEFQMCHTYLANQFLSPLWNHRTDAYGWDTLENRMRFSLETLRLLRKALGPDKILAVKHQGFDFPKGEGPDGNDGITPEMAAEFAAEIEKVGVDLITVSAGGTLTGKDNIMTGDVSRAEGWKVAAARTVKNAVSIPVAASGNIRHPDYIDQILTNGDCDMVGMGRGLLAEHDWVKKCEEGREDQLRYCLSCMRCWNMDMFAPDTSNCSVNPFACREDAVRPLKRDGDGRVVAVIGAGPAGMEAAVTLKQRGFAPVVFEKEATVGGNVNLAKKPPHKDRFQWQVDYYANMARDLGIDVRLNTEATVEAVTALKPYAVLVAAGCKVTVPPIPGLDQAETVQSHDVLHEDRVYAGKKMVVIGGGVAGMETAMYLRAQGNTVAVVDFLPEFPTNMFGGDPRFNMEAKIETENCYAQGIGMHYSNKVVKYEGGKLYLAHAQTGDETVLDADIVVLSTGVKPCDGLYNDLMAAGVQNVWKVGDANVTAKISKAVMNGSKFAYALK